MTTAHEKYMYARSELIHAIRTRNLIRSRFDGGGGGIGHIFSTKVGMTIYSQSHDGAKNYHDLPSSLCDHIANLITVGMIDEGLKNMEKSVAKLAGEAAKELEELQKVALTGHVF